MCGITPVTTKIEVNRVSILAFFFTRLCACITPRRRVIYSMWYLVTAIVVGACSTVEFYYQSVKGQLEIISKRDSIESLLEDSDVPDKLKQKLEQVNEIRQYASSELFLPDNESYTKYADLGRPYVLWNVFAAPELSVEAKSWCFPIAGCVNYRGYFDKQDAEEFAAELNERGNDVYIGGVPAYSTLGWFSDPILSTVIHYKDADLAALVFHELAHQLLYVKDDTVFNESFATAVELEGVRRWLGKHRKLDTIKDVELIARQRDRIIALLLDYRDRLDKIYLSSNSEQWKLTQKSKMLNSLKADYRRLRKGSNIRFGFDQWFEQNVNNAHLVSVSAYHELVPAFQRILAEQQGDLRKFYRAVERLSKMQKKTRDAVLNRSIVSK